jgi:glycosyltransferase involved in cell wall biosynthesis
MPGESAAARRIRVACVIDSVADHAGTENQLMELLRRIDTTRFDVHLCCLAASDRMREVEGRCQTAVFPVTQVFTPSGARGMLAFRNYVDRHGIDIVHTFMIKANIFGVLGARFSHCRAVVASRRNLGYWYSRKYHRLFKYLNRHSTRLLANSEGARRVAVELEAVPASKVDVLYNGVDMERYGAGRANPATPRALGIPENAPVVGVVANLRPVKDLPLFLNAARLVAAAVPDAVFLLVGKGPVRDELARLADDLGIRSKVFFSDGQGAVVDYLHRMRVACLSSSSEGFSNSILEYMAAGLPVVATDVGGNREAVEHGVTGYVVADRKPESFAAPIIDLLRDSRLAQAMGRAGFDRCRERFSMESAVRRHEDYYASLLDPKKLEPKTNATHS